MKRHVLSWMLATYVAVVAGCASSGHSADGTSAAPAHDVTLLDSTELTGHGYANTYVAMTATRPAWLRAMIGPPTGRDPNGRGPTNTRFPTADQVARAMDGGATPIGVFLEGSKQQLGVGYLNSLAVEQVAVVKHLNASEAMSIYGPEWAWGAIVIRLRQ